MQVNNVSTVNFGKLRYDRRAHQAIATLTADEIDLCSLRIVDKAGDLFHLAQRRNLDGYIKKLSKEKQALETRVNRILNKFKNALEVATQSPDKNLTITYNQKTKSLTAKVNDEVITYRKNNSILNFMDKVSGKVLS